MPIWGAVISCLSCTTTNNHLSGSLFSSKLATGTVPKPKAKENAKAKPKEAGVSTKPKPTLGIMKPIPISLALGSFLGVKKLSRAEAVKLPVDDPNGYEFATERWNPIHTVLSASIEAKMQACSGLAVMGYLQQPT
ncbi:hypothetical protein EV2_039174 [Malus domestica]